MKVVGYNVAKYLKFPEQTPYLYWEDDRTEVHLWCDPENIYHVTFPAPSAIEAVEYLWKRGIRISYEPVSEGCKGRIEGSVLSNIYPTPTDAMIGCLEWLCTR
ncbi:MAG: hypothetical protein J6I84_03240 [Bacilli bacterium]|nr:hypothetical protein [Bacilli bacterium]